ncbi:PPE domain-containing protein [Amycolatopsis sp. FBCC-B4732]|uniref:PPE domain-containing protein n=1 Tax=Amycolatopsis sp. FBCC-B4732 TaxID=3079339 RepID=UPI001FF6E935|nr:PPE domain-containing protein [Amycolatopsis sp. FBCC-B4732]UOX92335.1 PPE domain-containing protein [Amycolatopsis sp. FBCC-B4732]
MPEFHSTNHEPTARQKRKARRVRREKEANRREESFGKIHWDSYDHRELWDMIQSADPPKLGEQAYRWAELAKGVDAETSEVHKLVQSLLLSWRGPAAVRAADSIGKLTAWASTASTNAREIGDGLDAYTSAIGEARKKMPEPVHYWAEKWFQEGYAVKRLDGPEGAYMLDDLLDDKHPTKKQADDAKAAAVRVMEQYESASHDVRHRLPTFDTAPQVSVTGDRVPRVPLPPTPPDPPEPDPPTDPRVDPAPGSPAGDTTSTASALPAALTGAGLLPGALDGTIGPGGAATTGAAGPGFGGLIGSGALGEAGQAGSGRVGGAGPGGFGPGAPGGRGTAGGYGMYPPGQGARREEDTEHRDKYGSGYDLLDDLPPAYPPVFGE